MSALAAIPIFGPVFAGSEMNDEYQNLSREQRGASDAIKLNRPTLRRTQGGLEAEAFTRRNASTPIDQNYALGEQQIGQGRASRNRAITNTGASGSDVIAGIIDSDRLTRDQQVENLRGAYGRQANAQGQFVNQLNQKSGEELNMFDVNELHPYQQDYLRKYNLLDASQRNRMAGKQAETDGYLAVGNNITNVATSIAGAALTGGASTLVGGALSAGLGSGLGSALGGTMRGAGAGNTIGVMRPRYTD